MSTERADRDRRRQRPDLTRRRLFGGAAVLAGATAAVAAGTTLLPDAAAVGPDREQGDRLRLGEPGSSGVTLRWLGNNGWEVSFDDRVILIDPWLTRFKTGTYAPEGADPTTPIVSDPALIDPHVSRADQILVTHGHYDHLPDVPYLARATGATVLGTETHLNLIRALDADHATLDEQLSTVSGGEYIQFDGYTIQVLHSVHSMVGERARVPFPGTRPAAVPPRPATIADLVEGGTLAYQITTPGGLRIANFGASNFFAPALAGLRPHVALIQPGGATVHDYVPRLLAALDHPEYVLPTHWDDFDQPLSEPAVDWGGIEALRSAVSTASPDSRFVKVDHLQTFVP
ncbi:MBL fold metallo-hydrolase [Actinoalloteichus hymeniacidonis]|uniref:Zn-dependent hydrolase of beta-lactamase fold n=1 Tax=Actinoalloteichus hymeniacidonis TaxID=340345 RepID=A0AAC9HX49_9PSEU|nr:MBL fold metallo-hydrolase [Actinoalloteichus hymeniacidonis]AOS66095.1 putative Zn-dependent hydrolase of beta-lactamase fold [Actinoalloteichus hymeniacidonis]MBB5905801.1 L-ascorbate metabolism protein UlaG (beta-lactamase superfamily) [Actinoalloteichus hymeniacidonis]